MFSLIKKLNFLSEIIKSEEALRLLLQCFRFGLNTNSVADEEAKKKARLERFAPNSKIDSTEEEKRKARAIR